MEGQLKQLAASGANRDLAADEQLLQTLQSFSALLLSRTKQVEKTVQELSFDTAETDVRLRNALSGVALLMNKQFIENRVYEEDEATVSKAAEVGLGSTSAAAAATMNATILLTRLKDAYTTGMSALSTYSLSSYAQPGQAEGNRFNSIPLPYIIGTEGWRDDPLLGLARTQDAPVVDNNTAEVTTQQTTYGVASDAMPDSSGATQGAHAVPEGGSFPSAADTADYTNNNTNTSSHHQHIGSDEDTHQLVTIDEEEDLFAPPPADPRNALMAALAQRQSVAITSTTSQDIVTADSDEEAAPADPRASLMAALAARNPGASKPVAAVGIREESTAIVQKDDDDEEGGLFGPARPVVASSASTAYQADNGLATGLGSSLFGGPPASGRPSTTASLFGGDPLGSSLFGAAPAPANPASARPSVVASKSSLFADLDAATVAPAPAPVAAVTSAPKPTTASSSLFGGARSGGLFGDDDEPASNTAASSVPASTRPSGIFGAPAAARPSLFGRSSLFADDDDDDVKTLPSTGLFGAKPAGSAPAPAPAPQPISAVAKKPASSLFGARPSLFADDDDDDAPPMLTSSVTKPTVPAPAQSAPKSLASTSLFGSFEPAEAPKPAAAPAVVAAATSTVTSQPAANAGVKLGGFPVKSKRASTGSDSGWDNSDDDRRKPTNAPAPAPAPALASAPVVTMDDPLQASLFAQTPAPAPAPVAAQRPFGGIPLPTRPGMFPIAATTRKVSHDSDSGWDNSDNDTKQKPVMASKPTTLPPRAVSPDIDVTQPPPLPADPFLPDLPDVGASLFAAPPPARQAVAPPPVAASRAADAKPNTGVRALAAGMAIDPSKMMGGGMAAIAAAKARHTAAPDASDAISAAATQENPTEALLDRATLTEDGGNKRKRRPPTSAGAAALSSIPTAVDAALPTAAVTTTAAVSTTTAATTTVPKSMLGGSLFGDAPTSSLFGNNDSTSLFGSGSASSLFQ